MEGSTGTTRISARQHRAADAQEQAQSSAGADEGACACSHAHATDSNNTITQNAHHPTRTSHNTQHTTHNTQHTNTCMHTYTRQPAPLPRAPARTNTHTHGYLLPALPDGARAGARRPAAAPSSWRCECTPPAPSAGAIAVAMFGSMARSAAAAGCLSLPPLSQVGSHCLEDSMKKGRHNQGS